MKEVDISNAGAGYFSSGYLNKTSLIEFLGGKAKTLGKSTVNDWIKYKGFPKPIRLSQTYILWRISDVVTWVEERAAANSNEGAE